LFPERRGDSSLISGGMMAPPEKNFQARLAIPPQDEPLDDTWKGRHRDQRRHSRRVRRVEKAAQSFLDSRAFRAARVVLILLSGAMLAWLFQYLRTHEWRLPGTAPEFTDDSRPVAGGSPSDSVGDVADLIGDDDTEIPPASNRMPDLRDPFALPDTAVAGTPVPP
jgi:hypothetical protein